MNKLKEYGAFTIDNSIVKRHGVKFRKGLLFQLQQFRELYANSINFIITDVVFKEMEKHLKDEEKKVFDILSNFSRIVHEYFELDSNKITKIENHLNKQKDRILDEFIKNCSIQIIQSNDFVNMQCLIDKYFSNEAPFATTGSKKNEFPDAISLLCLEGWAKLNKKKILAISDDKDWKNFAEQSDWIDIVDDISDLNNLVKLLSLYKDEEQLQFNKNTVINIFKNKILEKSNNVIFGLIKDEIIDLVGKKVQDIELFACSNFNYEVFDIETQLEDIEFNLKDVALLEYSSERVVYLVPCEINFIVYANINFEIWDSIDREYVSIGDSSVESLNNIEYMDSIITIYGNLLDGSDELDVDVELVGKFHDIDLGEISPFTEEDYEKY